ncbi:MAG TPA: prepilin-type N-terminal cleavage/methylation domain-containing protein [Armatimonadota bacterium]|nr:prepilin-type N-terminal cleavage/methylation domain-containing protein [Armatimonadota bacterium]
MTARQSPGFTLVEVLVALVILLIGAYAALRLFPAGFAAIERSRQESIASRLADREIQRWRLAAGSLPEAIVWADSSSASLQYRPDYDPDDLRPKATNPNWEPDSVYLPRTIIGEMLPIGDVETAGAIRVPLCRLRFGPLEHLYDNPADGDPLFIYTTRYQRVDRVGFLLDATAPSPRDWERYYIDYDQGAISFDYVPSAAGGGYDRKFRVEFTYLTATGQGEERQVEMTDTTQLITVPAGWDTTPTGTALGQGPMSLWPVTQTIAPGGAVRDAAGTTVTITTMAPHEFTSGQKVIIAGLTPASFNGTFGPITVPPGPNPTTFDYAQAGTPSETGGGGTAGPLPADFEGVVPLSERIHQAFIFDGVGAAAPTGPAHFRLDQDIASPDAHLLCHPADAGRTVNVDYRVRDWQILTEERSPDTEMRIHLAVSPIKSGAYLNPPRQPARNRLLPGDDDMVIILDTETGARLDYVEGTPASSDFTVDYGNGVISFTAGDGSPPEPAGGRTYRIYYRGEMDWTVQPMKAAADYAVMVSATPGYRSAVWTAGTNLLDFGRSEVGKSVVASYYMYADAPANTNPRAVVGELHRIALAGDSARVQLAHDAAWGDLRIQGASMRARVLWAGRGRTRATGGEESPERWRSAVVETFLRR